MNSKIPVTYTNVSYLIPWIESQIEQQNVPKKNGKILSATARSIASSLSVGFYPSENYISECIAKEKFNFGQFLIFMMSQLRISDTQRAKLDQEAYSKTVREKIK